MSSASHALWAIILLRSTAENGGKELEINIEKRLSRCLEFGCLREKNSSFKMRRGPGGVGAINRQRLARVNATLSYNKYLHQQLKRNEMFRRTFCIGVQNG